MSYSPIFEPYIVNVNNNSNTTDNSECNSIVSKNAERNFLEIMKNLHKNQSMKENKYKDLFDEITKLQNCYRSLLNHVRYISKEINSLALLAITTTTTSSNSYGNDINELRKEILKLKEISIKGERKLSIFSELHQTKEELKRVKCHLNEECSENERLKCEINQLKVIMRRELLENTTTITAATTSSSSLSQDGKENHHFHHSSPSLAATIATTIPSPPSTTTTTTTTPSSGMSMSTTTFTTTFLKKMTELGMDWWHGQEQTKQQQAG